MAETTTRKKTTGTPTIFDVVEGVTVLHLVATEAQIAQVTKQIKSLERKRSLLMHQRAAQQIELTSLVAG